MISLSIRVRYSLLSFLVLSIFVSSNLWASIVFTRNGKDFRCKTVEYDNVKYVSLTHFLSPAQLTPVYNRVLHKVSFSHKKDAFILSPVSNAVCAKGIVRSFKKPLIVKKGVLYISKSAVKFIAPFLSYKLIGNVIVIDPGHGGDTEEGLGAVGILNGRKVFEKDIVLKFSKILGSLLEEAGYEVEYTRREDIELNLEDRTKKAGDSDALIFVSLHANSSFDKNARGIDIFYLSEEADDLYSSFVATVENRVFKEYKGDKDVGDIIKSMLFSGHIKESSVLAGKISSSLPKSVINRGVKKAPFYVLAGTTMPSVLIEVGFVSNTEDLKRLTTKSRLRSLASKIVDGIKSYLNTSKKRELK